jgi:hypothetical protein
LGEWSGRGFKRGNSNGGVKTLTGHLYAEAGWCTVARSGKRRWRHD